MEKLRKSIVPEFAERTQQSGEEEFGFAALIQQFKAPIATRSTAAPLIHKSNQNPVPVATQAQFQVPKSEQGPVDGRTNLIVNYLPQDMLERELYDLFAKFGSIRRLKIIRDLRTGYSFGYGFVDFVEPKPAAFAQLCVDGREVRGKRLKVSFARPQSEAIKNANLYVSYLPPHFTEKILGNMFKCYGKILEINILRNKYTGQSRGIAFVRFDQHMSAEMAREVLNNYTPPGSDRPLCVKFVERRIKPPVDGDLRSQRKQPMSMPMPMPHPQPKPQLQPQSQSIHATHPIQLVQSPQRPMGGSPPPYKRRLEISSESAPRPILKQPNQNLDFIGNFLKRPRVSFADL
ncbi:sex-lethal homolog [Scaptodrosophila lebanonensis]|uniref:Sex-lethal homolog n=1 Tax=Drosophila lebanonensis TaxID=7225 RepID=A0A6J2TH84_DROLE|nr:sex-lethal homolog [Scaptodrosophila lebanonensis]